MRIITNTLQPLDTYSKPSFKVLFGSQGFGSLIPFLWKIQWGILKELDFVPEDMGPPGKVSYRAKYLASGCLMTRVYCISSFGIWMTRLAHYHNVFLVHCTGLVLD